MVLYNVSNFPLNSDNGQNQYPVPYDMAFAPEYRITHKSIAVIEVDQLTLLHYKVHDPPVFSSNVSAPYLSGNSFSLISPFPYKIIQPK